LDARYPFGDQSPFLEIPWALNAHERLTLEAFRYSVAMVLCSYERLCASALQYSAGQPGKESEFSLRIAILTDAWAVLDALNKIRELILRYPAPAITRVRDVRTFIKQSESINAIRNQLQHLSEHLRRRIDLVGAAETVFGQVSWILVPDPENLSKMFLFGIVGGGVSQDELREQSIKASPIGGEEVEIPVGRFELHAFGKKTHLSKQITNLKICISAMEGWLRPVLRARAERAASASGVSPESLLRAGLGASAFRFDIGYGGEGGVSADKNVEVITSMKRPPVIF
jgi:hypothetical protein